MKQNIVHHWSWVSKAVHPICRKTHFSSASSSETWAYTIS